MSSTITIQTGTGRTVALQGDGAGTVADPFIIAVSGAPGGEATISDGADVAEGATDDAAVTDPTASATVIALLKGLLMDLQPPATSEAVDLASTDYTPASTTRALIVGVAGDVKVDTPNDTGVTLPLPAGQWSLKVTKIYKVGTDADNIVAQW